MVKQVRLGRVYWVRLQDPALLKFGHCPFTEEAWPGKATEKVLGGYMFYAIDPDTHCLLEPAYFVQERDLFFSEVIANAADRCKWCHYATCVYDTPRWVDNTPPPEDIAMDVNELPFEDKSEFDFEDPNYMRDPEECDELFLQPKEWFSQREAERRDRNRRAERDAAKTEEGFNGRPECGAGSAVAECDTCPEVQEEEQKQGTDLALQR